MNSARPDGVSWVPHKSPCIGTGLRDVLAADFNMRLGPVWCADDMPDVYSDKCEWVCAQGLRAASTAQAVRQACCRHCQ